MFLQVKIWSLNNFSFFSRIVGGTMRRAAIGIPLLVIVTVAAALEIEKRPLPELSAYPAQLSLQEFQDLFDASKRWGEFGEDDQLGALNLITPQTRVHAASLVKTGVSVSLANPLSKTAQGNFIEPIGHTTFVFDLPPGFDGGSLLPVTFSTSTIMAAFTPIWTALLTLVGAGSYTTASNSSPGKTAFLMLVLSTSRSMGFW